MEFFFLQELVIFLWNLPSTSWVRFLNLLWLRLLCLQLLALHFPSTVKDNKTQFAELVCFQSTPDMLNHSRLA